MAGQKNDLGTGNAGLQARRGEGHIGFPPEVWARAGSTESDVRIMKRLENHETA